MSETVDDEKKVQDEKTDVKSPEPSPEADKQSLQKPEFTKEQEKEVQDRVSAVFAKKGDEVKELEGRLKILESANKTLEDEKFATTATKYGLEVEKLKEAGVTDSSKIEAYANLFGKAKVPIVIPKADSGDTSGGGEKTEQQKLDERYPTMKK